MRNVLKTIFYILVVVTAALVGAKYVAPAIGRAVALYNVQATESRIAQSREFALRVYAEDPKIKKIRDRARKLTQKKNGPILLKIEETGEFAVNGELYDSRESVQSAGYIVSSTPQKCELIHIINRDEKEVVRRMAGPCPAFPTQ